MSAHRTKERIEFERLLKTVSPPNLAALHQQAQPMQRTAQLQAIVRGPQHTPIVFTPQVDRRISAEPYRPPQMGTPRAGAYDALRVPSIILNQRKPQP